MEEADRYKLDAPEVKPKLAKIKVDLSPEKKEGKILKIKSKGISEPSLMDLRSITDEEGKKLIEGQRIKRELKIRKKIKGM